MPEWMLLSCLVLIPLTKKKNKKTKKPHGTEIYTSIEQPFAFYQIPGPTLFIFLL